MYFLKLTVLIIGIVVGITLLIFHPPNKTSFKALISPLAESARSAQVFLKKVSGNSQLKTVVEKALEGTSGTYGIVIKNFATGESYSQNENMKFESASLYKLWVLGTVYEKIKSGELSKDEVLSRNITDLNKMFSIASEAAELTEGTITLRVSDAVEKMITISDNYSALLLSSKIRNSSIAEFMKKQGLTGSNLGVPPQTTPYDTALFFEKLYEGKIIDRQNSEIMLAILSRQQLNDRIPKYLPAQIKIAHKTGELNGFKHDAGIVYGQEPILIVVLSKSNAPLGAAERIANLSKDVYEYFEKK